MIAFGLALGLGCVLAVAEAAEPATAATAPATRPATRPSTAPNPSPASAPAVVPVEMVYFYSPTCLKCREAKPVILAGAERFARSVRLVQWNVNTPEGLEQRLAYEEKYAAEGPPPKVFIDGRPLLGAEAIKERLPEVLAAAVARRRAATTRRATQPAGGPTTQPGGGSRVQRFIGRIGPVGVAMAGLVDGVNPCAFATMVFLISVVGYVGRTRREVAVVGISFTLAVFLTYLALGITLAVGIGWLMEAKVLAAESRLMEVFIYVVVGLTLLLAAWSAYDAVRIAATGKVPAGALGLPKGVKDRIHKVIRTGMRTESLVIGSFVVGVIVSLLESVCTGQVYLPTIMVMLKLPGTRLAALGYLVVYNLMFIAPLAVVMALAYLGVGSETLGQAMKRHLALMKGSMAVVFIGLAALLILTM